MNLIDHKLCLYVRSMGKALRVTGVFATDAEANAHLARHDQDAVVAVSSGGLVLTANRHDVGADIGEKA